MSGFWWQLPGPAQFVQTIVQHFQSGQNVVICLPDHFPEGLAAAIRARAETTDLDRWYTLRADEEPDTPPVALLYSQILGQKPPVACSAATIAHEDAFGGWMIWVSDLTNQTWPAWRAFIEGYAHSCRARPITHRTTIGLVLQGDIACRPPAEDVCLIVHKWHDVVTRLDMLLYTTSQLPTSRFRSAVQHQLVINCIANIAQWDPLVADALIYESLQTILHPYDVLLDMARRRGWGRDRNGDAAWYTGRCGSVYGQQALHSAAAVLDNEQRRLIESRIWSAQVATLLPFVEEQRQELLRRLRRHLRVPFTTPEGALIEDSQDLEIGHIYWQLSDLRRQGLPNLDSAIDRARTLRKIRNDLAHLKCVPADLLSLL